MNFEIVANLAKQPHKSWFQVGHSVGRSLIGTGLTQLYLSSMGMGGSLLSLGTAVNVAVGAIWTVGMGETVAGVVRSISVLSTALGKFNWCVKRVPHHPEGTLAGGRLEGVRRDRTALDNQHWPRMSQYIGQPSLRDQLRRIWNHLDSTEIQRWSEGGYNEQNALEVSNKLNGLLFTLNPLDVAAILDGLYAARADIGSYLAARRNLDDESQRLAAVQGAYNQNIEDQVIRGSVNWQTRWMLVDAVWTLTTVAFTATTILFDLSVGAFNKREFAQMHFGKTAEEVAKICSAVASPAVDLAAKVNGWAFVSGSLRFVSSYLSSAMVLVRIGADASKGVNQLRKTLPYHCFVVGWFGIVPVQAVSWMLMAPLVAKCAFEGYFRKQWGFTKAGATVSLADVFADPHAEYGGVQGVVTSLLLRYLLPQMAWNYQTDRASLGVRHGSVIHEQGLPCALFSHVPA